MPIKVKLMKLDRQTNIGKSEVTARAYIIFQNIILKSEQNFHKTTLLNGFNIGCLIMTY